MSLKKIFNKSLVLYTLYTVAVLFFFLWYLFPSDFFADYLEKMVAVNGNGITAEIDTVKPGLPAGVKLTGVTVDLPEIGPVTIDYFRAGIKLSSLFRLKPEIGFATGILGGKISGTILVPKGDTANISVEDLIVENIDAGKAAAFIEKKLYGFTVAGQIDGAGHYSAAGRGSGLVTVGIKNLALKREEPLFSIAGLTFNEVRTEVEIKNRRLSLKSFNVDGEEFGGSLSGSILLKQPFEKSVLRLKGKLTVEKEFADKVPLDIVFRKKVKPGEELTFRLTGTVNKPRLR